jgi:hypothetical protein
MLTVDRLCHNVWGPHDHNFHNLWQELRDEWEVLQIKGFSGEGFLGKGQQLGGARIPPDEVKRRARVAAEERARLQKIMSSGRKLGGSSVAPPPRSRRRLRDMLASAASSRTASTSKVDSGCATGTNVGTKAAADALSNGFRTQGEMDDANSIAIAQALQELYEQEEDNRIYDGLAGLPATDGLTWDPTMGLQPASAPTSRSTTPKLPLGGSNAQHPARTTSLATSASGSSSTRQVGSNGLEINPHGRPVSRLVREAEVKAGKNSTTTQSPTPAFQNWPTSETGASLFGGSSSSTTRPISVSSSESAGGNWECLKCTFHNHDVMEKCEICDAPRARHPATRRSNTSTTTRTTNRLQKPLPPDPPVDHQPLGWVCTVCDTYMEHNWWTCSQCGTMKTSS